MAKTVGIIAEYNPFHNGHYYHLQKAKQEAEADFCVAVISGNFTQRGETSISKNGNFTRISTILLFEEINQQL